MNILNLPSLSVTDEIPKENDDDIGIQAIAAEPPKACPLCGSLANLSRFGTKKQKFMDTPMYGKRAAIILTRQRYKCKECNGVFFEPLPEGLDEHRNCTKRLIEKLERDSLKKTFVDLAEEVGVNEKTVRNIFYAHVSELESNRKLVTPRILGIDEIHLIGRARGVIANIEKRCIMELLPDRDKPAIGAYLMRLPDKQNIEYVAMDMWTGYRNVVNEILPHARVVVDKFHVLKAANDAVEVIRRDIRKGLSTKVRRQLKNDRFLMLRRRHSLTELQKVTVDSWTLNFPALGQAYDLKERFFEIFDAKHSQEAVILFKEWEESVPSSMKPFVDLAKTFNNWLHEILGYFDSGGITNAYTESLNAWIRHMDRKGRGHSYDVLRAKILFNDRARLPAYNKVNMMSDLAYGMEDEFQRWEYGSRISTLKMLLEDGAF